MPCRRSSRHPSGPSRGPSGAPRRWAMLAAPSSSIGRTAPPHSRWAVSYTHLRAHETSAHL
eukprot:269917-Alexandrium_andersonii.AAC.1